MTIADLGRGMQSRIVSISGDDSIRQHLETLGFVRGTQVTVVLESNGAMVLDVYGSRVAVGNEIAKRISVEGVPEPVQY